MDYGTMLAYHTDCSADMTISCLEVPAEEPQVPLALSR